MKFLNIFLAALSVQAKEAFVFLGATGDNALRPSGVWEGLFEAWCGGKLRSSSGDTAIFVAMNAPHTVAELEQKVLATLNPFYADISRSPGFSCFTSDGDCRPSTMLTILNVNIQPTRDACTQTQNMTASLEGYDKLTMYLSIPTSAFGDWATCAVKSWGSGKYTPSRIHVAAEKPFGTGVDDANNLFAQFKAAGLPDSNVHLVDHWLSFFMIKHFPAFRDIVAPRLGISWSSQSIARIVVTQFEERGLEGRGAFFDTVGQVRDMVQSHLLQVMGLFMVDASIKDLPTAKLAIFNKTTVNQCRFGQYKNFLLEPNLGYHPTYATSTFCDVTTDVNSATWANVPIQIITGKDMGQLIYSVDVFQRGGPGVLTYNIGVEEVGVGNILVKNWPLKDQSSFQAPVGGFDDSKTVTMTPRVSANGNGFILQYNDPNMYFPKPYGQMVAALLTGNYGDAFVTPAECKRSWQIVTDGDTEECLDPAAARVYVYEPPHPAPCTVVGPEQVCWSPENVSYLYDVTFACSSANDVQYANISFYQAKCHPHQ